MVHEILPPQTWRLRASSPGDVGRRQQHRGHSYNYSNNDLRNVINIGRDARSVIISKRQEREDMEAYSPTSNYRIPDDYLSPPWKCLHTNADSQGTSHDQRRAKAASAAERFNRALHDRCRWHPKGMHSTFECRALRKALSAPLAPNASPQA